MNLFYRYHRTTRIFEALRRDVRCRQQLVKRETSLPRLIAISNGSEAEGKSAVLFRKGHNILINCPESTSVVTGFIGNGSRLKNCLVTRPHWDNISGISSFLHIYYMDPGKADKFRVFGLNQSYDFPFHRATRNYFLSYPIGKEFEAQGLLINSFRLVGKSDRQITIAYHLLVEDVLEENAEKAMEEEEEDEEEEEEEDMQKDVEEEVEETMKENTKEIEREISSILVLEILDDAQIASFRSNKKLMKVLRANPPEAVLHFSERHMQDNPAFQRLIDDMPATCQHIFFDAELPSYLSPVWMRRHVIRHFFQNRRTYPLPPTLKSCLTKAKPDEVWRNLSSKDWNRLSTLVEDMRQSVLDGRLTLSQLAKYPGGFNDVFPPLLPLANPRPAPIGRPNCWSAHSLLTYHLGKNVWSDMLDITLDTSRLLASALAKNFHCDIDDIRRRAEELGKRIKQDEKSGALPAIINEYPKVIFLGTGSAFPTQYRNVTGILLRVDEENTILLDCGPGTVGRMFAFLGPEGTYETLKTLKAVCITHDHLDHYEGLLRLIIEWFKVNNNKSKLRILANNYVFHTIKRSINCFCPHVNLQRLVLSVLRQPAKFPLHPISDVQLEVAPVNHKFLAFGFGFRHVDGWHIAFSGDTMPCASMLRLGLRCDLLIHEATIEDNKEELAVKTKHSTMSQAISMARQMRAKRVVLTHFSQRSERYPVSLTDLPDHFVVASDGLQLSLDDVYYFRGDQVKTLANFVTYSFSNGNYQFFSEPPKFLHPPRSSERYSALSD